MNSIRQYSLLVKFHKCRTIWVLWTMMYQLSWLTVTVIDQGARLGSAYQPFQHLAHKHKLQCNQSRIYSDWLSIVISYHWQFFITCLYGRMVIVLMIFSCDQAALWMVFSVCPSVRLSVCLSVCLSVTPFWLCSHHRIIMKFLGVITKDQGKVHAKGQGQRSKVKVTEVTTQLNRFRTVTPVWIHIWWWNDTYSLMLLRRGALLFFKVIRQISRSHDAKNRGIWPRLGVSGL